VTHYEWEAPGPYRVVFSTRNGGVSEPPFATLNLGRKLGDDPERVDENRRRLCEYAGADPGRLAMNYQVHSSRVNRGRAGARGETGDGLWTDEPGVPLLALTADCVPVALAREDGPPALAVLHAGRIGLLGGIVAEGVRALKAASDEGESRRRAAENRGRLRRPLGGRVRAAIGPAAGPCCYEVGDEILQRYRARFGPSVLRGRNLDLWRATELALREAGVAHVHRFDLCTICNPDLFFSYRRDGTPRGGQGVLALVG
jgi:purine-nucleoside/S-methyl-5'-thioadenosine phosphorylase / adenosine deaminase